MILALVDNKVSAEGRKDLLEWLSRKLSGINDSSDAIQLLKPACSALTVLYCKQFGWNFWAYSMLVLL